MAGRIAAFHGDEADFASWLFTIARHRLADLRRTGARRRTDPVADVPDGELAHSTEDAALDEIGAQQAVALITATLTADQAEVVLLRTLGGLSARHVGAVMGRDETWVRVTHHRAMRRLHEQLTARAL